MRRLANRNTGSYTIEVIDLGFTGEEYILRVTYLGNWASGDAVDLYSIDLYDELDELGAGGEPGACGEADAIALNWFDTIRGGPRCCSLSGAQRVRPLHESLMMRATLTF